MANQPHVIASRGHVGFDFVKGVEYFEFEGNIYIASISNVIDCVTHYRTGGRFECSVGHFKQFRQIYSGLTRVKA